jgi:hypothetical protein
MTYHLPIGKLTAIIESDEVAQQGLARAIEIVDGEIVVRATDSCPLYGTFDVPDRKRIRSVTDAIARGHISPDYLQEIATATVSRAGCQLLRNGSCYVLKGSPNHDKIIDIRSCTPLNVAVDRWGFILATERYA